MAERKPLNPRAKKALVWTGMGATGFAAVILMTLQTTKEEPRREPEQTGLLGSADTRTAGLEGLSRRIQELEAEADKKTDSAVLSRLNELAAKSSRLEEIITQQRGEITALQGDLASARAVAPAVGGASGEGAGASGTVGGEQVLPNGTIAPGGAGAGATPGSQATSGLPSGAGTVNPGTTAKPSTEESRAALRDRIARGLDLAGEEVYAQPIETLYASPPVVAAAGPIAPKIVSHEPVRAAAPTIPPEVQAKIQAKAAADAAEAARADTGEAASEDPMERVPDLRVAAGSVLSAYMLTGLDAPTGSKADANPIPVLMRIKLEARMPNYAYADVMDCHLIGAAYGDLASERVNIRGEKVSCTLHNGQVFDGSTKFFVTGEDGKSGIRGKLVNRSGKMLARTALASLAQGATGVLAAKTGGTTVNLGGTGTGEGNASLGSVFGSNAGATASQGFQRLGDYYMELAEQTFPVIEVTNGRWVDVVLTDTMEVKFLRGSPFNAPGTSGVAYK